MTNHGEPTGTVLVSIVLRPLTEPPAHPHAALHVTNTVGTQTVEGQISRPAAEVQLLRLGYPAEAVPEIVDVVLQGHTVEASGYLPAWEY
jgi:hypothetical protein